jgi:hypothetical protein
LHPITLLIARIKKSKKKKAIETEGRKNQYTHSEIDPGKRTHTQARIQTLLMKKKKKK